MYSKSQTLFKKQDNLRYFFIHKNPHTLRYAIFHEIFKLAFIYIEKPWRFALRHVFSLKNPDTLHYAIFHGIFEICGGWEHFYEQKTMHFALKRFIQKTKHFPLRFYIQKVWHFVSHFYTQK